MLTKNEIRLNIKVKKSLLTSEKISESSYKISQSIESNIYFKNAKVIVSYWPLAKEVDIIKLNKKYCKTKTILLPAIHKEEIVLKQYCEKSVLKSGILGIQEPDGNEYNQLDKIDLVIVPGLAFDKNCNRLGRGKGYYDRFLKKVNAYKLGICYDFQLIEQVPVDGFDIKLDEVIYG